MKDFQKKYLNLLREIIRNHNSKHFTDADLETMELHEAILFYDALKDLPSTPKEPLITVLRKEFFKKESEK